jgi:signal transduction histidine kinase/integral membrane sensor domain MASE1
MSVTRISPAPAGSIDLKGGAQTALVVFCAYLLAAEAAFFIGTLSDKIFAPFWPPNVVLLLALLCVPPERRWICVAAALPAHVIAELKVGMPIAPLTIAFITNVLVAAISFVAIRHFIGEAPWFNNFRKASLYVVLVGLVAPGAIAFGGAFVPLLAGGTAANYWLYWGQWFAANAVGSLTLGPAALMLMSEGASSFWPARLSRQIEAVVSLLALIAVCDIGFSASAGHPSQVFLPALLYSPVPLILWASARFGMRGASTAILVMTVVLIWRSLNGPSLFIDGNAETNVFALQIFLASIAAPVILLGASIDEARQAERRKHEDEERMAVVAATANVGLWKYDLATRQFWATEHCRTMLGLPRHLALNSDSFLDAVHPDDRPVAIEVMSAHAGPAPVEFRVCLPNGQTRWLAARADARYEDDTLTGTSGVFADITERKVAEAEADLQRRELTHLMRVSQVGELSGGLAHELTQPLTSILANAQAAQSMLARGKPDLTELSDVLEDIIQEDNRAGEVIQRLRSLLKNGKEDFDAVDLNGLIQSTLRLLRGETINRRIRINAAPADDLPAVSGDAVQLQQVLLNLVMNAIDAVNQMSTLRRVITLKTLKAADGGIEVSVVDRGTGIGVGDQDRIFEPFFTTKERGLGLGLSICATIIKRHGGDLSLCNNSDGGATASFRLPASTSKRQ